MSNEQVSELINKLGRYYNSEYIALNQPWILQTPFEEWLQKQLIQRGIVAYEI